MGCRAQRSTQERLPILKPALLQVVIFQVHEDSGQNAWVRVALPLDHAERRLKRRHGLRMALYVAVQ